MYLIFSGYFAAEGLIYPFWPTWLASLGFGASQISDAARKKHTEMAWNMSSVASIMLCRSTRPFSVAKAVCGGRPLAVI